MTKKKLVFLINSLDGGGAERVITTLLNELVKTHNCYLILIEHKIKYDLDDRVNLITLNINKEGGSLKKLLMIPVLTYKLSKLIKEQNFKQIVSFLHRSNYINILSKFFVQHNAIISERTTPSAMYNDHSMLSYINKFLTTKLYRYADVIIPASYGISNDLKYNFGIVKEQNVIYNPCNIEKIQQSSLEHSNIKFVKEKTIITVGSLEKVKNHHVLIGAFSMLNDEYRLVIVGQGSLEKELKELVFELGIENRVIFIGFDNNPYKYIAKASIFVLSSNSEGFPNVLVEAMICGCNVISTDCLSGPREILAPKTDISVQLENDIEFAEYGILLPVGNKDKLFEAMQTLITNSTLQDNYRKKALMRIKELDVKLIVKDYERVICSKNMYCMNFQDRCKKVVAFTKYSYDGPSSRYRFYNYIDCFKNNNIDLIIKPLFERNYLISSNNIKKIFIVLYVYIKRILILLKLLIFNKNYSLVIVEYELLPYFPPLFEYLFKKRGINYFVDYDDAIFHRYDMNKNSIIQLFFKNKIAKVIAHAKKVIVCNNYLASYAIRHNENIFRLPTVVILDKYIQALKQYKEESSQYFVIGWIGSRTTSSYILDIMPVIEKIVLLYPSVRFDLVGFDNKLLTENQMAKNNINTIPWIEKDEINNILDFDIGIMPLDNTPWSKGKCGFKLIQYMSCKKPVIASPVGVNVDIVEEGINGFLVESLDEWFDAFEKLYLDKNLREKMAINNFEKIKEFYNHEKNCEKYINEIKNVINE